MNATFRWSLLFGLCCVAGCAQAPAVADSGAEADAQLTPRDAGAELDAALPGVDAGPSSMDAGEADSSLDVPDAPPEDAGGAIDATSVDASAVESGPPDGGPNDAAVSCPTPGMTRGVPCGNCGMRRQMCTDGFWVDASACLNEGVCAAGTTQMLGPVRCASRHRDCTDACTWGAIVIDGPQGECDPGVRRACFPRDGTYGETCGADCTWGPPDPRCVH